MEKREHFLFLFRSIAVGDCRAWNDWRIENPGVNPALTGLDLRNLNLPFINLSKSDLRLASLREVNLYRANLQGSDLSMTILKGSILREANMKSAKLFHANLRGADLRDANLAGADLRRADLRDALLEGANLTGAVLDEDALQQTGDCYIGDGVSRLERIALQLKKHRATKKISPAVARIGKVLPF